MKYDFYDLIFLTCVCIVFFIKLLMVDVASMIALALLYCFYHRAGNLEEENDRLRKVKLRGKTE